MDMSRVVVSCVAGLTMFLAAQVLYTSPAIAGQSQKVEICHFPPGNRANFQTITVSANALPAHLEHGDFPGPCANDCSLFATVCDDHNACTVDTCNPDGTCKNSLPTDCNDGNACTTDACEPSTGDCKNTPKTGATCDDTNDCTSGDVCNAAGQCAGTSTPGCCLSNANCDDTSACTTDICNLTTKTCSNTSRNCDDSNACTVDSCNSSDGSCLNAPVSCAAGQTCNPGSGLCQYTDPICGVRGGSPGPGNNQYDAMFSTTLEACQSSCDANAICQCIVWAATSHICSLHSAPCSAFFTPTPSVLFYYSKSCP